MTFRQYTDFEKAIIKDQIGSEKSVFLGSDADIIRNNQLAKLPPWRPEMLTRVENTSRACRGCHGTRYRSERHYNGLWSLVKCPACKGSGRVFG